MSTRAAEFELWCWLRTAGDPAVAEFRDILAALPETPPTMRRTGFKFINGKQTSFDTPAEPGEGWDGECL